MSTPVIQSDRYELLEQVGEGAAGALFRGRDVLLQRPIAIKLIQAVRDPTRLAYFYSQWAIQASLTHPNIGEVRDIADCAADGARTPMLVTPWLEGKSLADLTAPGAHALDAALAVEIVNQAAEGLAHAHERGLVHGNLKRSNVFVCSDGIVKLLDFGLLDQSKELDLQAIQRQDVARLGKLLDGILDVIAPSPALPRLRSVARNARDGGLRYASELPALLREALGGSSGSLAVPQEGAPEDAASSVGVLLEDAAQRARAKDFTSALEAVGDALRLSPASETALALKREIEMLSVQSMAGGSVDTAAIDKSVARALGAAASPASEGLEPREALQRIESGMAQQEQPAERKSEPPKSRLQAALDEPDLNRRIELLAELSSSEPKDRLAAAALSRNERKRDQVTAMSACARRLEQAGNPAAARDQWLILTAIHPSAEAAAEAARLEKLNGEPPVSQQTPPGERPSSSAGRGTMRSVSTDSLRLSAEEAERLKPRVAGAERDSAEATPGAQRFASTDTLRLTADQAEILAKSGPGGGGGEVRPATQSGVAQGVETDAGKGVPAAGAPETAAPEAGAADADFTEEDFAYNTNSYELLPSESDSVVKEYEDFFVDSERRAVAENDDDLAAVDWSEDAGAPLEPAEDADETEAEMPETAGGYGAGLQVSLKTLLVAGGSAIIILALVVMALFSGKPSTPASALEQVAVTAFPPDAEILLDGEPCGKGQCLGQLEAGSHRVTAHLAGYAMAFELIEAAPAADGAKENEPRSVRLELTPLMPGLHIEADLERATVYLDGREAGRLEDGEFQLAMLPEGEHEIRVAGGGVEARAKIFVEGARAPRVESLSAREAKVLIVSGVGERATLHASAEGREVSVDGAVVGRTAAAGLELYTPAEGSHEAVVGADGDRMAVGFDVEDTPRLAMVLQTDRNVGALRITTGVDGATVYLNDRPYRRETSRGRLTVYLAPNEYRVRVEKDGYRRGAEQTATIRKGEQARLEFVLEPEPRVARLRITDGVAGARVFVDGESAGTIDSRGSFTRAGLEPGSHLIEIQAEGYQPVSVRRSFEEGAEVEVQAEMRRELGDLQIEVTPATADVSLSLQREGEAEPRSIDDRRLSLMPGTYTVRAEAPGYEPAGTTVTLEAGETRAAVLTLNPVVSREAPAGPVDLLPALLESGDGWTRAGLGVERRGGEFVAIPGARRAGVYQFRARLEKGRRLQWAAHYFDESNYGWFQLGRNRFYRTVVASGDRSKAVEAEHAVDDFRDVAIRIEISPDTIVHRLLAGGSWVEIDRWKITGAGFDKGEVGFRLPGKDQLILTELSFEPR